MDRQRTNETLGSTTEIPQHPGPVDGNRTGEEETEARSARGGEAEQGRMAQRGAAAAQARSAPDDEDARAEEAYEPASPNAAAPGGPWHGQEMAREPAGVAERKAARAENRMPKRRGDEDDLPPIPHAPPMSDEEVRVTQELKRQAAVEDHEADRAAGTGTAPKNL
jgi:hypothetical protein